MNLPALSRAGRRALEREQHKFVSQFPKQLEPIPPAFWPKDRIEPNRIAVWRSRDFLVQVFCEANQIMRLSVCRTKLDGTRWQDGITWDELQQIKKEVGMGDKFAVEIYPADADVVNVANMRHLWILPEAPAFAWRN